MSQYEEGIKIIEEKCGNNKDNVISLATIALETGTHGTPVPDVRDVDAYYEDGVFYVVTYGKSNKMLQIEQNKAVAFSVNFENITGSGVAENLGWVLDPKNAKLRTKLRTVFAKWYDEANDESDVNFCYLAIHITKAVVVTGHGATTKKYYMDFLNRKEIDEVKEMKERDAFYFTFGGKNAIKEGRDYIFKWFLENNIDSKNQKGPIYIFGSYNLTIKQDDDFEYTLYLIIPKNIKLAHKPLKKKVFGGIFARRFVAFENLESSWKNLYDNFQDDKTYKVYSPVITEQYLLDNDELTKDTQVLQLLSLIKI